MRVSIEIFLIDNWLMNCATLCCASALSGLRFRKIVAPLLCLLGAIYALLALSAWQALLSPFIRLGVGLVLALGLRVDGWKSYARAALCVLLCAFLLGGLVLGLTLLFRGRGAYGVANGILIGVIEVRLALVCIVAAAMLPRFLRHLRSVARVEGGTVRLRMQVSGRKLDVLALLDTGNLLVEPITGLPVVLLAGCPPIERGYPLSFQGMGGVGEILCGRVERAETLLNGRWRKIDIMVAPAPYPIGQADAIIGSLALPPTDAAVGSVPAG